MALGRGVDLCNELTQTVLTVDMNDNDTVLTYNLISN